MPSPSKADIAKKQAELAKHLKKLADPETGQQKIPALITMVRGAIRSSWSICPVKLAYFEMGREPDTSSNLCKWKMRCEHCQRFYKTDAIEIDHKNDSNTFTKPSDFESFFDNILDVQFKDLQRLCKYRCHRIKSHLHARDFESMTEAACDKVNIFLTKFTDTVDYTKWLVDNGITPESSAPKRRKQGLQLILDKNFEEDYIMDFFEACDHLMRLEAKKKKAKRFKLNEKDYTFIRLYNSFWEETGMVKPKTSLSTV